MKEGTSPATPARKRRSTASSIQDGPAAATLTSPGAGAGDGNVAFEPAEGDLDHLLRSTNLAMLHVDRQMGVRRFTPAVTALFALTPTDIGRPIGDLAQHFTDPVFLDDIRTVLEHGGASRKEVLSSEGRWYVRQTLPCLAPGGTPEGAVVTFSDAAADALHEARLYAETIVNSVREPLLVLDRGFFVHSINQPFSALFHLTTQDVFGRALRDLGTEVWNVPELQARLGGVLEGGVPMEGFEVPYHSGELGPRTLILNARPLHRGGGRPDLILVAVDDATDRRRVDHILRENETRRREEERIRRRQVELADALRVSTVGELATGLAHELNQPLASIANVVEACVQYVRAGTIAPDKLLALLSDAASETQRAAGIVAHLRSFVDKGEPRLASVDLSEIVGNVPHLLLRELERTRVALRMDLPAGELPVMADRIQIEQVVVNLIQNAMDSIEEADGSQRLIELGASSIEGCAEISVRDTGTGVSEPAVERLFQAFFTTKSRGLGMGLALSRSILEAHRGRIWMESPSDGGPGTVVRFSIPLQGHQRRRKDGNA